MIDKIRFGLYVVLIVIFLLMYQAWEKDHPKAPEVTPVAQTNTVPSTTSNNYVPDVAPAKSAMSVASTETPALASANKKVIQVKTDVFNVSIDPVGGNIIGVDLIKYPESLHSQTPVALLNDDPASRYIAQSGLLSSIGPDTSKGQATYSSEKTDYTLSTDQNELQVKLNWKDSQGLSVSKVFTFKRSSYEIGVAYQVDNQTKSPWSGNLYMQLMRKNAPPVSSQGIVSFATYFGAAISSPDKPYQKISFKEMATNNLNQTITGGWAAMIQHYFVSAWVPEKNTSSQYFSKITGDGLYTIGMISQKTDVNPGQTATIQSKFYAGPSIASQLETVAPGLQLTIDYGWLWIISAAIFWLMQHIYNIIGNWGWSIVLVTLVIKLLFYKLSAKSYRSMSAMKKLQPRLNQLKEKFGSDKQKFTQATIELYRKEKVNPMSGCLPILIQIPVFIGLYWVLIESVQLRQAPFIFWIHDLSVSDPFYVLPVLMGISMFLQQRLNPPPPDPTQAKVMMLMPIIFTVMFLKFPAGLMLYWFVNNSVSFLQQWFIMRSMNADVKK